MDTKKIINLTSKVRNSANEFIEKELEKHGFKGIVPAHGEILNILYKKHHEIPMKRLVELTGKAKSTITSNIATLLKYGFIEKKQDPSDARSQLIALTQKGKDSENLIYQISDKLLAKTYENISVEEQRKVVEILEKIVANFQ